VDGATAGEALRIAGERLAGAPAPAADGTPRLDAEVLLRHVLGLDFDRSALFTHPERRLSAAERRRFDALVERREGGEPVAYLTGTREFMGLPFAVDRRALVPRPETEVLAERALAFLALLAGLRGTGEELVRVVDVGTGSGAIAVAVAALAPRPEGLRVFATDLSGPALAVARRNAARLLGPGRPRVDFVQGSFLEALRGPFDLVLANLPYVPSGEVPGLPASVSRYEPALALDGGPDGLDLYRALLADLEAKLRPGGAVLLECDPGQAPALAGLVAAALPEAAVRILRDLAGRDRVVEGVAARR
jgi:release factor glutamine methyltransferase